MTGEEKKETGRPLPASRVYNIARKRERGVDCYRTYTAPLFISIAAAN